MAALPTVIVTGILDVNQHPTDPNKVLFMIEYRLLFIPSSNSPPQVEQAELVLPDNFSKQDVRNAAHSAIIASVAAKGSSISSNRIFGVDDLV